MQGSDINPQTLTLHSVVNSHIAHACVATDELAFSNYTHSLHATQP
jgi:acyl-[acyl carrier protein]--UDP-N-acetylglucosamine O-acyltransferase